MNLNQGLTDLVAVGVVAVLAPLVVALLPGPRIPQVVIFLFGGVLIGPHVLGLAETSAIQLLANVGLGSGNGRASWRWSAGLYPP
jgi:Kef-type K+ transport system membrane component KefB